AYRQKAVEHIREQVGDKRVICALSGCVDSSVAALLIHEALAPQARAIGPTVVAKSLRDALKDDTIILAVPFGEHREVARALP
ncbi:hypothetical protein ACC827_37970, partial [Rhizobium ruizarguesonis]